MTGNNLIKCIREIGCEASEVEIWNKELEEMTIKSVNRLHNIDKDGKKIKRLVIVAEKQENKE